MLSLRVFQWHLTHVGMAAGVRSNVEAKRDKMTQIVPCHVRLRRAAARHVVRKRLGLSDHVGGYEERRRETESMHDRRGSVRVVQIPVVKRDRDKPFGRPPALQLRKEAAS